MAIEREDVGSVLRDQKQENFCQEWARTGDRNAAYMSSYHPEGGKTRTQITNRAWTLEQKDHIRARLQVLQQAKAKASIDQQVITQREVVEKMLEFTERMHNADLPSHEAKGLDMLGKATGAYKAPERTDKLRERTDDELKAALTNLGFNLNADTPNRTADGPSGGAEDPEAADVSAVPETEALPHSRPN